MTSTQTRPAGPAVRPGPGLTRRRRIREQYQRSPVFALTLLIGVGVTIVGFAIPVFLDDTVAGIVDDIVDHTSTWPTALRYLPAAATVAIHILLVVALNGWLLVTRRFRRWMLMNLAVALSAVIVTVMVFLLDSVADGLGIERDGVAIFPATLANVAAAATLLRPWIRRRLHRLLMVAAVFVGGGVALSAGAPGGSLGLPPISVDVAEAQLSGLVALLGVGMCSGALVGLAFKTPPRTATADEIAATLQHSGFDVIGIHRAGVDARGSTPWFADTSDGRTLFVKVLGTDERAADLLFRFWRLLMLKRSGDRAPFLSLRRGVEHQAFMSLSAAARGVRTPPLAAVGEVGDTAFMIAYEAIAGATLADAGPDALTDETLAAVWHEVATLRAAGLAHRDLRLANVLVDPDGRPWIIDFGFGELTAERELLDRDVAELLAASAVVVGPERAVKVATGVMGPDDVAAGLTWLQPLTLSAATRRAVGRDKAVHEVRQRMAAVLELQEVEPAEVRRIGLRQLATWGALGIAVVILAGQLSDFEALWREITNIEPMAVLVAVIASLLTYLGAAVSIIGSVPQRLRFGPTLATQVASSFVNRVTPARVGGMATNVRYLVRRGVPMAGAVSAIGLNTLAGILIHVVLLITAAGAVGRSPQGFGVPLPSARTSMLIAGAVIIASAVVLVTSWGRKMVVAHVVPAMRTAWQSLVGVAAHPSRIAQLMLGSLVVTVGYVAAMVASLAAFGASIPVTVAAFAFLAGSAVATVAPTPGGLGVVEAALVAAYTSVGVAPEVAVPAVLLFRLATYWLPIIPGWLAFAQLTRRRVI